MKIKKVLSILLTAVPFLFFSGSARALEIIKIGTLDVTGDGIGSTVSAYTYPLRSFSLYGKDANASSSVAIKVDDVTYSATANADGGWSTYLSNLTYADHTVTISSTGQTALNFTLTISSSSATQSTTSTTTTTASTTTTTTLPATGTTENTFILAAFALLAAGLGVAMKYRE